MYDDATSGTYRLGRLYQTSDPTGSKTYTYDRRGNVTNCAQVANGTTYTTSYGYDGNGNRTSMTLPSGRALTYTFDYADRPYSVSGSYSGSPKTYVSSTTYSPFGPRLATSFGNGTTQTFTYDQRYLPTENKLINGSSTLSNLSYTTNAVGFVTQITDNLNAAHDITYIYGGNATNMMTDMNTGSALWDKAHYADAYAQNVTLSLLPGSSARTFKLSQRTGQIQSVFAPFRGLLYQCEINALSVVYKTVTIAVPGTSEKYLREHLNAEHIQMIEQAPGYGDAGHEYLDPIIVVRAKAHVVLFSWGYEVVIYINPSTDKIDRFHVGTFGEGI